MFFAVEDRKASRAVADDACHIYRIAGSGAAARHHPALRHKSECRDGDRQRSFRRRRIPAQQRNTVTRLIGGEAGGEVRQPFLGHTGWQCDGEQITIGRRALGRQIRQIHPQRFFRDGCGRIVFEEVRAFGDLVHGDNQIEAGPRRNRRRIVLQSESARRGRKRREMTGDDAKLIHRPPLKSRSRRPAPARRTPACACGAPCDPARH